jgi:hypothetical protein
VGHEKSVIVLQMKQIILQFQIVVFQSETVDGINELADVLSLHLGGT